MKKRIIIFTFKILISIALLLYFFSKYDIRLIKDSIINIGYLLVIVSIAISFIQTLLNSFVQKKAFEIFKYDVNIFKIISANFTGSFLGVLLPSTLGKDIYLTYLFGKKVNSYSNILSCILSIRLLGFLVFLFLFIVLAILNKGQLLSIIIKESFVKMDYSIYYALIICLFILITIYFFIKEKMKLLYFKIKTIIQNIRIIIFNNSKSLIIIIFILLWEITSIGGRLLMAKLLGIELDFITILLIIVFVNFLLTLPLSFIGIGVREISYISLFSLFNIETQKAFALSNLDFTIYLTAIIIGAFIYMFAKIDRIKIS